MTVPSQARPAKCHTSHAATPDAQTGHNSQARPDSTPLTDTDLAEIEARVNAATPGPWWREGRAREMVRCGDWPVFSAGSDAYGSHGLLDAVIDNAAFIAHARQDVPALLAEVRRSREREQDLTRKLRDRDEIIGDSLPALGKHARDFSQRALIEACKVTGSDPYDWTDHPDVLDRLTGAASSATPQETT